MKNALTCGRSKEGLSLIEVLVVLLIIALMLRSAAPRLLYQKSERLDEYAEQVSKLIRIAYASALTTGALHRVLFRTVEPREISIERESGRDRNGAPTFTPLQQALVPTRIAVDPHIIVQNFYIKGVDEATRGTLHEAWLYIFPIGITQDTIINIRDSESDEERGLVLHPFSAKFTVYDRLQKP